MLNCTGLQIPESPRSRSATRTSDRDQPFPFPELHADPDPGSSRHEALQEGQLAGLPTLDWLSENPASDARGRPGNLASAARQPSGGLIDGSIGDPAELLSQPNAPFLLNFLSSREDDGRQASRKDSAPGARWVLTACAVLAGYAVLFTAAPMQPRGTR